MPYRFLCNGVPRESTNASPDLASGLFCYASLVGGQRGAVWCFDLPETFLVVSQLVLFRPLPPNEVGYRRGPSRAFSVTPFPNDTGEFLRMSLSRETCPGHRDRERTYTFRGLSTRCY